MSYYRLLEKEYKRRHPIYKKDYKKVSMKKIVYKIVYTMRKQSIVYKYSEYLMAKFGDFEVSYILSSLKNKFFHFTATFLMCPIILL